MTADQFLDGEYDGRDGTIEDWDKREDWDNEFMSVLDLKTAALENLRTAVHCALDNALENGYDIVLTAGPYLIADDLLEYDADLEGWTSADLIPHIKTWQEAHR